MMGLTRYAYVLGRIPYIIIFERRANYDYSKSDIDKISLPYNLASCDAFAAKYVVPSIELVVVVLKMEDVPEENIKV